MGIYRLKKLLDQTCLGKGVYRYNSVRELINKMGKNIEYTIAIDTYSYCYKYQKAGRLFEGFLDQIEKFYAQGIKLIYIFDGKSPEDKKKNAKKTKVSLNLSVIKSKIETMPHEQLIPYMEEYISEKKNKNDIDDNFIEEVCDFLKKRDIPWEHSIFLSSTNSGITNEYKPIISSSNKIDLQEMFKRTGVAHYIAKGEADDVLADLCKHNIVNACLSDDMDLLPKGCDNLIQINQNGIVTQYVLSDILRTLNLGMNQFVDLCILMGSDYYKSFRPFLKIDELFSLFIQYPSIESFTDKYAATINAQIADHKEGYCKVRKYFIRPNPVDLSKYANINTDFVFNISALKNEIMRIRLKQNEERPRYVRNNNSKYYQMCPTDTIPEQRSSHLSRSST